MVRQHLAAAAKPTTLLAKLLLDSFVASCLPPGPPLTAARLTADDGLRRALDADNPLLWSLAFENRPLAADPGALVVWDQQWQAGVLQAACEGNLGCLVAWAHRQPTLMPRAALGAWLQARARVILDTERARPSTDALGQRPGHFHPLGTLSQTDQIRAFLQILSPPDARLQPVDCAHLFTLGGLHPESWVSPLLTWACWPEPCQRAYQTWLSDPAHHPVRAHILAQRVGAAAGRTLAGSPETRALRRRALDLPILRQQQASLALLGGPAARDLARSFLKTGGLRQPSRKQGWIQCLATKLRSWLPDAEDARSSGATGCAGRLVLAYPDPTHPLAWQRLIWAHTVGTAVGPALRQHLLDPLARAIDIQGYTAHRLDAGLEPLQDLLLQAHGARHLATLAPGLRHLFSPARVDRLCRALRHGWQQLERTPAWGEDRPGTERFLATLAAVDDLAQSQPPDCVFRQAVTHLLATLIEARTAVFEQAWGPERADRIAALPALARSQRLAQALPASGDSGGRRTRF